jgi:hypothetical protein
MTYLTGFIVIEMNDRFYSDWLGAGPAAPPIGPQLRERERKRQENPATPLQIRSELRADLSCDTPLPNRSTLQQIQDKLHETVLFYYYYVSHICISEIIRK